ncbi:MAG: DUF126 domain-containing protein [Syntrophales bacterium]|jgi:predicted aconitase with swiveling domain
MIKLRGKGVVKGSGTGPAMVTKMPMNFTAALSKPHNLIPWNRSEIRDRHHELFKKNIRGTVLVIPACIGSTYTGMILLELMYRRTAPAAIIAQNADTLLVSGAILADVWFESGIPIVEYASDDIYEKIRNGNRVEVNGATGEITIF